MEHCLLSVVVLFTSVVAGEPVFDFGSSDFAKVIKTTGFVDKTLLIPLVVEDEVALATAPRKFGKSTNLDMIKRFFEIEVDDNGNPKSKYLDECVNDTSNYELFTKNKLKITSDEHFMKKYFGKHPVISVDFKCDRVLKNYEDVIDFCRHIVQGAFKQHSYLMRSTVLHESDVRQFKKFHDCKEKEITVMDTHVALQFLSRHLYEHFKEKECVVLVDNHDSILKNIIVNMKEKEDRLPSAKLNINIMQNVMKHNDNTKYGLITGVLPIPLIGFIITFDNYKKRLFLSDDRYAEFYGLTEEEVHNLFANPAFKVDPGLIPVAKAAYDGYISKGGLTVYNIYSLLNFLKTGAVGNYWAESETLQQLRTILKHSDYRGVIEKLLKEGGCIKSEERVGDGGYLFYSFALDWQSMLLSPETISKNDTSRDSLLRFLLEEGYLTRKGPGDYSSSQINVDIPNYEVREAFKELIK